jgi:peptide subunit release factor 1 (eRF1)
MPLAFMGPLKAHSRTGEDAAMISKQDILKLLRRPDGQHPMLSVFLDTSVNSVNQRTYQVFLDKEIAKFQELDSDRPGHNREALGAAFERVYRWLDEEFDEANKGVAIYTEIGGDWLEGVQFPVPVRNRLTISDRPVIGPLVQVVENDHRHGLIVVDRVRLRMVGVYLGQVFAEHEVRTEPYPAPHDERAGGEAAKDRQKRKAEEVRHFFKEFALEVAEFDRRYRPDDLILLGTRENVVHFLDFLPQQQRDKVVHMEHAPVLAGTAEILQRLAPYFERQAQEQRMRAADLLHDRVEHQHLAVSGFDDTLTQLQEGRVDTLVLARDLEYHGAHCRHCDFYLARQDFTCPYCSSDLEHGVDLAEAMIRLAEEQEVRLEFVAPEAVLDLGGVGALLKF